MESKPGYWLKRIFDIAVSALGLIVLSPLLIILALLVRVKLGTPVFFRQERPGLHEKIFRLYKFRSMKDARDQAGNLLPDEVRLTRFGKILRASSLDELPELFNVLKGEMSLVGPRPLLVKYLPLYNAEQHRRHDVLPGITGWAQVNGRDCVSAEEKVYFDKEYLLNRSVFLDVFIFIKTVAVVIGGQGYVEGRRN